MKDKLNISSIDEATRKTMEYINESIIDAIEEKMQALQFTDAFKKVDKQIGELSGKVDKINSSNTEKLEKLHEKIMSAIKDIQETAHQEFRNIFFEAQSLQTNELTKKFSEAQSMQTNELAKKFSEAQSIQTNELAKKFSEAQSMQTNELDSFKTVIVSKFSKLDEVIAENHQVTAKEIKSLEAKIDAISLIIENQNRNTQLLEEISEKLDYLNLPFYKRMGKKPHRGSNTAPDMNKETE